jgi:hypothetical protein
MSYTPPSLYLFHPGKELGNGPYLGRQEGRQDADGLTKQLIFADAEIVTECYYIRAGRFGTEDCAQSIFLFG